MLFLTVPTAGNRQDLLQGLADRSGVPVERVVIVATRPEIRVPAGTTVVEDLGPPNIQRWWNRGIEAAIAAGATAVAVVNDDVRLAPETMPRLHHALVASGAAIASPSRPPYEDGLHRGLPLPYEPRLWGSLWVLDVRSGVRPDPRYVWWYGDNDLDIRARTRGGVVLVDVPFEHLHPGESTARDPHLPNLTDQDAVTFEHQYRRLLRRSRRVQQRQHSPRKRFPWR